MGTAIMTKLALQFFFSPKFFRENYDSPDTSMMTKSSHRERERMIVYRVRLVPCTLFCHFWNKSDALWTLTLYERPFYYRLWRAKEREENDKCNESTELFRWENERWLHLIAYKRGIFFDVISYLSPEALHHYSLALQLRDCISHISHLGTQL